MYRDANLEVENERLRNRVAELETMSKPKTKPVEINPWTEDQCDNARMAVLVVAFIASIPIAIAGFNVSSRLFGVSLVAVSVMLIWSCLRLITGHWNWIKGAFL